MGLKTIFAQRGRQHIQVMHQRFAAGNHRNAAGMIHGIIYYVADRFYRMFAYIPAFFYIAPHTTHIAAAQAYKPGRFSLVKSFTLEGIERFHDGKLNIRMYRRKHPAKLTRKAGRTNLEW